VQQEEELLLLISAGFHPAKILVPSMVRLLLGTLAVIALADAPPGPEGPAIVRLDPPEQGFFAKALDYRGIPIKAAAVVEDRALVEAPAVLDRLLGKTPDVLWNLRMEGAALHIIGRDQATSDPPVRAPQAPVEEIQALLPAGGESPGRAPGDLLVLLAEGSLERDQDLARAGLDSLERPGRGTPDLRVLQAACQGRRGGRARPHQLEPRSRRRQAQTAVHPSAQT